MKNPSTPIAYITSTSMTLLETGFRVTCGITFTFGGLRVDEHARVLDASGRPIGGLFAAGELVGGLFFHNYPGGSGLTAGSVFGRRAGRSATS
jgi:tricarballylate dehydrogenase